MVSCVDTEGIFMEKGELNFPFHISIFTFQFSLCSALSAHHLHKDEHTDLQQVIIIVQMCTYFKKQKKEGCATTGTSSPAIRKLLFFCLVYYIWLMAADGVLILFLSECNLCRPFCHIVSCRQSLCVWYRWVHCRRILRQDYRALYIRL